VPAGGGALARDVYVKFTVSEPLLLSPFVFGKTQSNNSGMYGIQNMSFNFNIGDASTVWRHYGTSAGAGGTSTINTVSIVRFENSRLVCQFLTPHPSDQLSSRCCVPFYELPRYITSNLTAAPQLPAPANAGVPSVEAKDNVYSSSTISLNQIPDKLIIFLRRKTRTWNTTDSFLAINNININWNNQTGLLSSFDQQSLWRMSVEAGSNQTFDEFRGYAYRPSNVADEKTDGSGAGSYVSTCGSILMLNMGEHLNLVEDYYAPGSIGSFNLQVKVTAKNYDSAAFEPELVIIAMNSGVFATERGTSSTYTALLTKQDVLDASMQEPVSKSEYTRMVGGGFLDSLKSAWNWLKQPGRLSKIANAGLNVYDITKGGPTSGSTKGREIVKVLGGARSGGAMSGGLSSRLR
jgi:hypothetical protein